MITIQKAKYWLHYALRRIEDLFFPPRCPVCDELLAPGDRRIHASCRQELFPTGDQVCVHCGRPVYHEKDEYCSECRKKIQPGKKNLHPECSRTENFCPGINGFTQAKAVLIYHGTVKISMYRLKYSNRREYALFYAELAESAYRDWICRNRIECIIPVPMYPKKKRQRGYNQAETFASELGYCLGLPVEKKMVFRVKNTKPLKSMNGEERRQILKGAFTVNRALLKERRYSSILLVDDIYTTGSTVSEIAGNLREAGIDRIFVLTICTAE